MIPFYGRAIFKIGILLSSLSSCRETVSNLTETMVQPMEINDMIRQKNIDELIKAHFSPQNLGIKSPIFPYKSNFHLQPEQVTFCSLPIIDGWALISNSDYTLFLLLPKNDLKNAIFRNHGHPYTTMEIEIDGRSDSEPMYSWDSSGVNIILHKYRNIKKIKNYYSCYMVVIGNMNYEDIVVLPKF